MFASYLAHQESARKVLRGKKSLDLLELSLEVHLKRAIDWRVCCCVVLCCVVLCCVVLEMADDEEGTAASSTAASMARTCEHY
jgi:hypothetical protein